MNWINVNQQLPPEAESVLVTDGGCYAVAYMAATDWVDTNTERPLTWWTDDGYSYWEPTYWMPLPHGPSSFLPNVMMSHAVAWRGGCAAASVTSNRIGSIYWLGSVSFLVW
jgi:hypothetical protein